jgi:hypothetical protein
MSGDDIVVATKISSESQEVERDKEKRGSGVIQDESRSWTRGKEKKYDNCFSVCAARPLVPNLHHPSQVYGLIPIRFQMLIEKTIGCVFNEKGNV